MKSVFSNEPYCFICGMPTNVMHHIFEGTGRRQRSEKRGFKIPICGYHHNLSDDGVHFNKPLDLRLKQMAQKYYEENIGSREDFINEFSKNYL